MVGIWNHRHENNQKHGNKKMKQSSAWKDLERKAAKALGGYRICRANNFAISAPDVYVPDFPEMMVDTKRRKRSFTTHSMLKEVRKKYCKNGGVAVLVTHNHREVGAVVSLSLKDFASLLNKIRSLEGQGNEDQTSVGDVCSNNKRS